MKDGFSFVHADLFIQL